MKAGVFTPNCPVTFQLVEEKNTWSQKDLYSKSEELSPYTVVLQYVQRAWFLNPLRIQKSMDVQVLI